jgi:hypothetical protein
MAMTEVNNNKEEVNEKPLEVIAYAKVDDDGEIIEISKSEFTGWRQAELVKKRDAQAHAAEERSRKYDEGFLEGRKSKEEEVER